MKPTDTSDFPDEFYPTAADVANFTSRVLTSMALRLDAAGVLSLREFGEGLRVPQGEAQTPDLILQELFSRIMIASDTSPPDLKVVD